MKELSKRIEYMIKCLFLIDGSLEMEGHFISSCINPFSGYWLNDNGISKTYADLK
mgnify:CR=1 FL=1